MMCYYAQILLKNLYSRHAWNTFICLIFLGMLFDFELDISVLLSKKLPIQIQQ